MSVVLQPEVFPETVRPAAAAERRPTAAAARWIAAVLLIMYGFAKVNGAQFRMIDSELAKPLGEVSGFWLTWYYFGYSPAYKLLLAAVEIGGAVLLVIPQTSLLGALVLLPVAANILIIDILYGVNALPTAVAVLVCVVIAIAGHARALHAALRLHVAESWRHTAIRLAIIGVLLVGSYTFNAYLGTSETRDPTPVDGVWSVVEDTRPVDSGKQFRHVFFELNRAWMAVFRDTAGGDERRHFDVDAAGVIRIWQVWRSKGDLLMEGKETGPGIIDLKVAKAQGGGHVRLRRISGPVAR
jgi:hypothetical protein